MTTKIVGIRMTPQRAAQIAALEERTGLQGTASVVDFALASAIASTQCTPQVKEDRSKLERIRGAIAGNFVGVNPALDVYTVYGKYQSRDETPEFIEIAVFRTGVGMTEEDWNHGVARRGKIVQMLEKAGIMDFNVSAGTIIFLND